MNLDNYKRLFKETQRTSNNFSLTNHQEEVMHKILNYFSNSYYDKKKRMVLQGLAGTGKTFLLDRLIGEFKHSIDRYKKIYCAAPTNKAVSVLKSKIYEEVVFTTVHKGLQLKRTIDNQGNFIFKQDIKPGREPFKNCALLIIDEASMISRKIYDDFIVNLDFPVLFVGDENQINPVGEEDSVIFHKGFKTVELTEIIRQEKDNPIIQLSRNLGDIPKGISIVNNGKGVTYTSDQKRFIEKLAEANGSDEFKYLAWTNSLVNKMNKDVRYRIYGSKPKMIEKEEILIFDTPYKKYTTNEEFLVRDVNIYNDIFFPFPLDTENKIEFKLYRINDNVNVIHENSIKDYKKVKSLLYSKCKKGEFHWKTYFNFVEQFANFKYNHALTVHKAQGSTYTRTIVNYTDIMRNQKEKERTRLLYTAVTRASELLIFNI